MRMVSATESYASNGKKVPIELLCPASPKSAPVVLILHGSFGLLPQYRPDILSFATALNALGIAAALPHYLDSTGTSPGTGVFAEIATNRDRWHVACADALAAIASDGRFDAERMGVLGFSLGGYLALRLAMSPLAHGKLRAAVDFFGPVKMLENKWSRLPPLLIFHGANDPLVAPGESTGLAAELVKAGRTSPRDFELKTYPGQGHGFTGPALKDSRERTCTFFKNKLAAASSGSR
jgi:dienelactone hydrolase